MPEDTPVPKSPQDVCPLLPGVAVPSTQLRTTDGSDFDLKAAVSETPTVIVFYRGGW